MKTTRTKCALKIWWSRLCNWLNREASLSKREKLITRRKERQRWWKKWSRLWERMSASISSICWRQWSFETKNRSQMSMSDLTIWLKSCERWRWMSTIWSIACFSRVNEAILSRVKIISRICLRATLLQISRSCSARDHSRCLFRICLLRICRLRLCHFWTMKLRVRLLLNVFTATKRIICRKENVLNSTRIWKLKEFTCKKEEFISTFIILISLTFEWFFTKVSDNVSRMQRS
jgi:hypothetical protein